MKTVELQERLTEIFQHLHENPEVSWKEYNTTAYITKFLEKEGVSYKVFDDCPGVIAEMGNGKPVIAIRADMDALWQEVDGKFKANHSCGHDAHMTITMGLILQLKNASWESGTVRFIFQPAEEKGNGALKMVEKGAVDDADFLFGVHLRPIEELPLKKAAPSIRHGAAGFLEANIHGDDAHGARPHQGVNAIDVISMINIGLKNIWLSPQKSYSVKMTKCQAGGDNLNIIPGNGQFGLDVRAESNVLLEELTNKIEHVIQSAESMGTKISYEWVDIAPGAEVSEEAEQLMRKGILEIYGEDGCTPPLYTTGSDDFHYYTVKRPHLKAVMLGLGANLKPGLHHPYMKFDHACIIDGVEIMKQTVLKALK
ncbi:M20 peptidase aminoacylase family protein [Bacillus pseudomycoides]|uniref:M20 peptidase aminoacylase family protein n=1 Tax=Bacillus pseudomycoides TaxID=64104 RepID=UPI000BEBE299|nr:M20 peptidase aminoacylase family protein [Bacillus pseudomycoides]PEE40502.1 amidohydrolase [Bacillus pseudomycoides]PEI92587.1 amidohydrolase [Bacillus pseudomycoides]PGA92356.1 amidohydrolase [Bacillus pseudomycoides]PHF46201.1 amidohydrolase [Bacillus pseudomycoides]